MSDTNAHNLKIKIETDEYIYWEYTEDNMKSVEKPMD
jgi:hypothetical protein